MVAYLSDGQGTWIFSRNTAGAFCSTQQSTLDSETNLDTKMHNDAGSNQPLVSGCLDENGTPTPLDVKWIHYALCWKDGRISTALAKALELKTK